MLLSLIQKIKQPGFIKYSSNTLWLFGSKAITLAISFIVTAYIVRYLGPEKYGILSYAISFVSIFSVLSNLGIDQIIYRDLVKYPNESGKYAGSAFYIKLIAGLLTSIVTMLFAYLYSNDNLSTILICIISVSFIFNSFNIISFEFRSKVLSKYPSVINILVAIILSILKLTVIFYNKGIIYLSIILLSESIFNLLFYVIFKKIYYPEQSKWQFDTRIAKKIVFDSFPLIFSSTFALIYLRIDQVIIKNIMDSSAVGIYDSAVKLSEIWYAIPNLLIMSLFPALINAKTLSDEHFISRISKLTYFLILISIIISLPITLLAPFIIKAVYGKEFILAAGVLQIYIWSNVSIVLSNVITNLLIIENKKKTMFYSNFISMILNIILNLILIPIYGIYGAALATLISYTSQPLIAMVDRDTRFITLKSLRIKNLK